MVHDTVRTALALVLPAVAHSMLRVYVVRKLVQDVFGLYSLTFTVYASGLILGASNTSLASARYTVQLQSQPMIQARLLD